jgi:hypothetical protein
MSVVHSVGVAAGISTAVGVGIAVRTPNELAPALAQREKPVVIENDELAKRISRLAYWQEARRWWFIAALFSGLVA